MRDLELILAEAMCGGSYRAPCRYHVAQAKIALNAIAGSGMVVVPVEPTSAMLHAAGKALSPGRRPTPEYVPVREKHRIRYRAMIAAAGGQEAAQSLEVEVE